MFDTMLRYKIRFWTEFHGTRFFSEKPVQTGGVEQFFTNSSTVDSSELILTTWRDSSGKKKKKVLRSQVGFGDELCDFNWVRMLIEEEGPALVSAISSDGLFF